MVSLRFCTFSSTSVVFDSVDIVHLYHRHCSVQLFQMKTVIRLLCVFCFSYIHFQLCLKCFRWKLATKCVHVEDVYNDDFYGFTMALEMNNGLMFLWVFNELLLFFSVQILEILPYNTKSSILPCHLNWCSWILELANGPIKTVTFIVWWNKKTR